jgi:hypothetical protein
LSLKLVHKIQVSSFAKISVQSFLNQIISHFFTIEKSFIHSFNLKISFFKIGHLPLKISFLKEIFLSKLDIISNNVFTIILILF